MKQTVTILTICWFASSCATLLNKPTTYVHVQTTKPAMIVHGIDSIKTVKNRALLTLERSKEPVTITTISDSLKNQITIKSKNSIAYKYNIFTLGIGFLFDKNSPKRYEYPWTVNINPTDTSAKIYDYFMTPQKGNLFLHVSLPYINNFYFSPENENIKLNTGFLGFSVGLDYFYNKNKFINFSASVVSDFFLPFPAPIDFEGEYELMSSSYMSLSNNHKVKRFALGYGISYVKNNWFYRDYGSSDSITQTGEFINKSHNTFGLVFSSYYQIGRTFNIGLVYRPTFFRLNTQDKYEYEHLISIDFAWKIRIKQ